MTVTAMTPAILTSVPCAALLQALLVVTLVSGCAPAPLTGGEAATDRNQHRHEQMQAAVDKLRRKHKETLTYDLDDERGLILATALDERGRREARERVVALVEALRGGLFRQATNRLLTVVIPARWANPRVTGHFYPPAYVDAANIGSTLRHEITHAVHYADQRARGQEHPVWLMEGLARLHEDATVADGVVTPCLTHRMVELQAELAAGRIHPFPVLLALEHRAFTSRHYAQAGGMLLYLSMNGHLQRFYDLYTAGHAQDASGRVALEAVCGKPLAEIQQDWLAWALALPPALPLPNDGRPSLGASFIPFADGMRIDQLAAAGPAAQAGLLAGDVLITVDGVRIITEDDLIPVVFTHPIGASLTLEFRRGGSYLTTRVTIGRGITAPAPPAAEEATAD